MAFVIKNRNQANQYYSMGTGSVGSTSATYANAFKFTTVEAAVYTATVLNGGSWTWVVMEV